MTKDMLKVYSEEQKGRDGDDDEILREPLPIKWAQEALSIVT